MLFRVLGRLEAHDGTRAHHLGAPMQRALLAHLLLTAGRPLPVGELVDRLWDGAAPARAVGTLHVHVLRLRRALAATGCAARVETGPRTYRLDLGADAVDAEDFRRTLDAATAATDPAAELAALDAALDLWRGDVLAGVPGDWPRYREVRALTELRATARERRAEANLAARRFGVAVEELRGLVAEHPDREHLRHLLVLALHRAGRRAEALAAYDAAYRFAADHLGLEPGAELRRLQRMVLHGEEPPRPGPRATGPCALPARRGRLVGRDEPLADLAAALRAGTSTCVVTGMPGVGKSALALWLAHALRDDFPDGQLHAGLDGGRADPSAVLDRFLRLLGVPDDLVPPGLEARAELFRARTTDRALLVVLDDAADAAGVRALLPGDGRSAVIVTSRNPLAALDGAVRRRVDVLGEPDSVALLADLAGAARVAREPAAARLVAERCGHLPLALRVAGALLAAHPDRSVGALADLLADERTRLDRLTCEDLSVRARFDRAGEALGEVERHALRVLGAAPAGEITAASTAALLGAAPERGRAVVAALADAHLITEASGGYRMPRLIRLYAAHRQRSAASTGRAAG
ncbi:AfsR/SARP family transcriptional regulator [Saccharothrix xinjiangensis]|uniref:BTAD domain-containing putative transcriptional regulator n=1 Tax=Saccharothrix xinjiangensis TaxID=204798 RepID=A0ABV9YA11_9PSEU